MAIQNHTDTQRIKNDPVADPFHVKDSTYNKITNELAVYADHIAKENQLNQPSAIDNRPQAVPLNNELETIGMDQNLALTSNAVAGETNNGQMLAKQVMNMETQVLVSLDEMKVTKEAITVGAAVGATIGFILFTIFILVIRGTRRFFQSKSIKQQGKQQSQMNLNYQIDISPTYIQYNRNTLSIEDSLATPDSLHHDTRLENFSPERNSIEDISINIEEEEGYTTGNESLTSVDIDAID